MLRFPDFREISSSLYGAWRLARMDKDGLKFFNISIAGFWNSFFAAVILAPLYGILVLLQFSHLGVIPAPDPMKYGLAHGIGYVISWTVFPILMLSVVKMLKREFHYVRFITVYNWAAVLQNGLYIPLAIFAELGLFSPDAGTFFGMVVMSAVLFYLWFIARTTLQIKPGAAAALVFFDLLVSIIMTGWTDTVALS